MLLPTVYEDAGIPGGTLERPGLQRLLDDIDAGLVDQIVVYKVDRLTRSLSDFAKLVERLEAAGAVFVSVTPSCAKTRLCLLFIHPPAHGSEVSPAARNTLDSARIPRASKLRICGLFPKGRVLAQDGVCPHRLPTRVLD